MSTADDSPTLETLLGHSAWVRGLARTLVRDADLAEDLVQETWLQALRRPPTSGENLKGWLGTVVRRLAARRSERAGQAGERERRVARPEALPATAELVERAARQREVVEEVLELEPRDREVVLLRHFEELPPRMIAELLDVPVATVNSRLQRAHDRLRCALERRHGDGGRWCVALAPLLRPSLVQTLTMPPEGASIASEPAAGSTADLLSPLTLALSMKLSLTAAGLAAIALTVYLVRRAPGADPAGAAQSVATAEPTAGPSALGSPGAADRSRRSLPAVFAVAPASLAPAGADAGPVEADGELRLVDLAGRALVGLRLRPVDGNLVRWSGGDPVWVNGGGETQQISLDDQRRLREDAAFAEAFVAEREQPEEWRSGLLGTPFPEREVRSESGGRVPLDGDPAAAPIAVVEPGWTLLGAAVPDGRQAPTWLVAAPAAQLAGVITDADGRPIRRARVQLAPDARATLDARARGLRLVELVEPPTIYSQSDGGFALRDVPSVPGLEFEVAAEGFESRRLPVPAADDFNLAIELRASDAPPVEFGGRVLEPDGSPAEGATVFLGIARTTTDAEGRFEFELAEIEASATLAVVHPPFRALHEPNFGRSLLVPDGAMTDHALLLEGLARTLRGRVVDGSGRPLEGVSLNLFDPDLPDTTFSTLERLSGERDRQVLTDDDGRFELSGLSDRSYRLRLFDVERALFHVTEQIGPDAEFVELEVPDRAHREVRGQVVDGDGRGVAGARLAVVIDTFVNRSGAGTMNEIMTPVEADDEGRFVLPAVPRRHARIGVDAGGRQGAVPVEWVDDADELVIVHPPGLALRVRVEGPLDGLRLVARDGAGRAMAFSAWGNPAARESFGTAPAARRSAELAVPVAARELLLVDGDRVVARVPIPEWYGRIVDLTLTP